MGNAEFQKENTMNIADSDRILDEQRSPYQQGDDFSRDDSTTTNSITLNQKVLNRRKNIFESPVPTSLDDEDTDREAESTSKPPIAPNPFAREVPLSPPLKRKNVLHNISELTGSPSPNQKKLNRQSSIAQEVRTKRLHDK